MGKPTFARPCLRAQFDRRWTFRRHLQPCLRGLSAKSSFPPPRAANRNATLSLSWLRIIAPRHGQLLASIEEEVTWLRTRKTVLHNPAEAGRRRRVPRQSPPPDLPPRKGLPLPSVRSPRQWRAPDPQRNPRLFPRSPAPPQDRAQQHARPPARHDRLLRRGPVPHPARKAAC
jgi:hypothetical protein